MIVEEIMTRRVKVLFFFLLMCALWIYWILFIRERWQNDTAEVLMLSEYLKNHSPTQEYYKTACLGRNFEHKIDKLGDNINLLRNSSNKNCSELYDKFTSFYEVDLSVAPQKVGVEFAKVMKSWVGNSTGVMKRIEQQRVLVVHDKIRQITTVYNPLRRSRPIVKSKKSQKLYLKELLKSSREHCDFCSPIDMTAEDTFGRIFGKYSVTASNAFKLGKWHGLFIPYEHDIFEINEQIFMDVFNTSLKWFKKVVSIDSSAQYPTLFWDIFPHSGASQVHVHVHGLAGVNHYPGDFKDLLQQVNLYLKTTGVHYWKSFIDIHEVFGLALRYGNVIAISPMVPRKEHELWILSEEPSREFFQLLYYIIKMYQESLEKYCFSMAGVLPPTKKESNSLSLPAVLMIGTRGDCLSPVNDISSLELFLFNNVNTDPYETIAALEHFMDSLQPDNEIKEAMVNLWTSQ